VSCRRKDHAAGNEDLDLAGAPAQLFARGLAHLADSVRDHRHDRKRPRLAARIDHFVRGAKAGAAAGLSQRAPGVEQPGPDDFAFGQKPGNAMIRAARFPDRGETVHQARLQIVGGGNRNFRGRIRHVARAQ